MASHLLDLFRARESNGMRVTVARGLASAGYGAAAHCEPAVGATTRLVALRWSYCMRLAGKTALALAALTIDHRH